MLILIIYLTIFRCIHANVEAEIEVTYESPKNETQSFLEKVLLQEDRNLIDVNGNEKASSDGSSINYYSNALELLKLFIIKFFRRHCARKLNSKEIGKILIEEFSKK